MLENLQTAGLGNNIAGGGREALWCASWAAPCLSMTTCGSFRVTVREILFNILV